MSFFPGDPLKSASHVRADSPRVFTEAKFAVSLRRFRIGASSTTTVFRRLERTFRFKNFRLALAFTDRVGELAESEAHHPQIVTEWGEVAVAWWTHAIRGLHRNDYVMAAKTDQLYHLNRHDPRN